MNARIVITIAIAIVAALLGGVTAAEAAPPPPASTAHESAGPRRVVVAGPASDPIATRLEKELIAMGFDPIRVDDAAGCARPAIAGWIGEAHALGAVCTSGDDVMVWVMSPQGLRMAEVVSPRDGADPSPGVLAVRAAEIVRASLELPEGEADAEAVAPAAPVPVTSDIRPAPTWTSVPPPAGAERDRAKPRKTPQGPRTPLFTAGAGFAAVVGADASDPAFDLDAQLRVARFMALTAHLDLPTQSTRIPIERGMVKIAPAVFAVGASFPLMAPESFLVPRLGAGGGFVWLRSEGDKNATAPPPGPDGSQPTFSNPATTSRDDIFSPLVYGSAALSLRIAGPVRLVLEGMLGTTIQRMVVRDRGADIAYWGAPFGTLALRGEVVIR